MKMRKFDYLALAVLFFGIALLVCISGYAQEKLVLTAPIMVETGASQFGIAFVAFDWDQPQVHVRFKECDTSGNFLNSGRVKNIHVTGADASAAMNFLETANFSTLSFKKRVISWLQTKGYIGAGTVTGAPVLPTTTTTTTLAP